jgi:hypothetical protein
MDMQHAVVTVISISYMVVTEFYTHTSAENLNLNKMGKCKPTSFDGTYM